MSPLISHAPLKILTPEVGSPVKSPTTATAEIVSGPRGAAELDVNVNYTAGCQRGHISRLSIPVHQPFRFALPLKLPYPFCSICGPLIPLACNEPISAAHRHLRQNAKVFRASISIQANRCVKVEVIFRAAMACRPDFCQWWTIPCVHSASQVDRKGNFLQDTCHRKGIAGAESGPAN